MSENSLKEFFSHTSRVWNSAVTITMAGIALSVAAMFTQPFISLPIFLRVLLVITFYLGIVFFGFYRILELGCQLQFLETELKVNDASLLEYISGKDGKTGNIPRIGFFRRLSLEEAKHLKGKKIGLSMFVTHHRFELVVLAISYAVILAVPYLAT
jgi:hypothetical protein